MRFEHVKPTIADVSDSFVHLFQRLALQKVVKHLRLEDFDQLELASTLEFESFQFFQRAVLVEHGVSFFNEHALFLRSWKNHRLIRTVDFKLDAHF